VLDEVGPARPDTATERAKNLVLHQWMRVEEIANEMLRRFA